MEEVENETERQAQTPSQRIVADEPQMSEVSTLANIFFEPGRTFDDLRRKPRFIMAAVIMALLITFFSFAFYYKIGENGFRSFYSDQVDKSSQSQSLDAEAKNSMVDTYMTIGTVVRYTMPLLILFTFALGGMIYWLASKAFGGTGNYLHGLSTWVYASFPPTIVSMAANFIILAFKSGEEIDIASSTGGLIRANPGFFIDGKSMPVLATLLGALDLILIWGWILSAIGLQRTQRISSGSAWAITLILGLILITFKVVGALFSGNPS